MMSVVGYVITACSYHFVVAVWRVKAAEFTEWSIGRESLTISGKPIGVAAVSQVPMMRTDNFGLWPQGVRGGGRFIVHGDEKLIAFAELEAEISHAQASAEPVTAYQARPYKNLIKLRYNSANCLKQVIFCANSPRT